MEHSISRACSPQFNMGRMHTTHPSMGTPKNVTGRSQLCNCEESQLHLGDFADAFVQTNFIHTFTHQWLIQPCRATGVVRMRCLAQGHLDTELGRGRDRTSSLPVIREPVLPPELHPRGCRHQAHNRIVCVCVLYIGL